MRQPYFVDHMESKIIISSAFRRKAGVLNSVEFITYMELKKTFPGYVFEEKKQTKRAGACTYKKLTYDTMEKFIVDHDPNAEAVLEIFKKVKLEARYKSAPYSFVKHWFLEKYKTEYTSTQYSEKTSDEERQEKAS